MFIEKNITHYIIFSEDSIVNALKKINENKKRFIITVSVNGVVEGIATDGDFRRWVVKQREIDLSKPVSEIHNTNFNCATIDDSNDAISSKFTHNIDSVPLLDQSRRLRGIAFRDSIGIQIEDLTISEVSPVFIIAEIGNNHNGSLALAKKLVDHAVKAGADCAKFQLRDMKTLYRNYESGTAKGKEDLGAEYTLDLLAKYQLNDEDMFRAFDYCRQKGIIPLCTPWDLVSLKKLEEYGMSAYKVASADLTNPQLLTELMKTNKPLLCSSGMSSESEIAASIRLMKSQNVSFVLLHCNSTYPTPIKDVNLNYMDRLKKIGADLIGYSGHERGIHIPIAAVAKGAKVVEKHLTMDRNMEGNDHKVSLLPVEFKEMVACIREIELGLGEGKERFVSQGEKINREVLAKSLMINCDLKKSHRITRDMVDIKSPGTGLAPYHMDDLIGRKLKRDMIKGEIFFMSDISNDAQMPRAYNFNRPFGIPIRYHDFIELSALSNFDFIEFHLSYRDLELSSDEYLNKDQKIDFLVHSPELFKHDHVMDLASLDDQYRLQSLRELQRVIDVTRDLKRFFPGTHNPKIIINAGGFSLNQMLPEELKPKMYDKVAKGIMDIDTEGVELLIQTMPPFPWHFGGQRFHNLFLNPFEIKQFCDKWDMRVCFDISHSMLACNYFQWSFDHFAELVGPYTGHIHLVDAKGTDGEGLQIGEGDIDFRQVGLLLDQYAPDVGFIPEIWQGHKNSGEGFWTALNRLEKYL